MALRDIHKHEAPPLLLARAKMEAQDFPGSWVGKNTAANAGDTGSIPGLGRFHMPQSN